MSCLENSRGTFSCADPGNSARTDSEVQTELRIEGEERRHADASVTDIVLIADAASMEAMSLARSLCLAVSKSTVRSASAQTLFNTVDAPPEQDAEALGACSTVLVLLLDVKIMFFFRRGWWASNLQDLTFLKFLTF